MHAPFGQVGMQVPGMPLGVHLGMPHQMAGRPPFFERPFPVVRLRGLPFNAVELDIFDFFQARAAMCQPRRHAHRRPRHGRSRRLRPPESRAATEACPGGPRQRVRGGFHAAPRVQQRA